MRVLYDILALYQDNLPLYSITMDQEHRGTHTYTQNLNWINIFRGDGNNLDYGTANNDYLDVTSNETAWRSCSALGAYLSLVFEFLLFRPNFLFVCRFAALA
jgi:hypothetical protein